MYKVIFKRILDIIGSISLLILFLPIIISLALVLLIINRGRVFFLQNRPGKLTKVISVIKFKTMRDTVDEYGMLLSDAKRITLLGRIIRSTSLDELPQLFNVLKGDMSLVGPRPLLVKYLPLYTPEQARRHEVRPGITGWTQVTGRNSLSWEEKFERDVWYVDHMSFALDMKILWLTVIKVFKREGINQAGQATMKAFTGSNNDISEN